MNKDHRFWCDAAAIPPEDVLAHFVVPSTFCVKMPHANDVKRANLLNSSAVIDKQFQCADCGRDLSEQPALIALRVIVRKTLRDAWTTSAGYCTECARGREVIVDINNPHAHYGIVIRMLKESAAAVENVETLDDYVDAFVSNMTRRQIAFMRGGCWSCDKESTTLLNCGKCKYARYCNRECQLRDWADGHRTQCVHIQTYSFIAPRKKWSFIKK